MVFIPLGATWPSPGIVAANNVAAANANRIVPLTPIPLKPLLLCYRCPDPAVLAKYRFVTLSIQVASLPVRNPSPLVIPTGGRDLQSSPSNRTCGSAIPQRRLFSRLFPTHPLLLQCFQVLLFIPRPGKTIRERHRHYRNPIPGHQRPSLLLLGSDWESMLSNNLHRARNRNAHLTAGPVNPAVVIEQQILSRVHFRDLLVAVIG